MNNEDFWSITTYTQILMNKSYAHKKYAIPNKEQRLCYSLQYECVASARSIRFPILCSIKSVILHDFLSVC